MDQKQPHPVVNVVQILILAQVIATLMMVTFMMPVSKKMVRNLHHYFNKHICLSFSHVMKLILHKSNAPNMAREHHVRFHNLL